MTWQTEIDSPIGSLLITCNDDGITGLHMGAHAMGEVHEHQVLQRARKQLEEYFAGARTSFDLPLAAQGTDFQRNVWKRLCEIPYGRTASYGELAARIGNPKASRAVGAANGRNPIAVIVPCHRVIGADGSLTGFGGGLERKQWLLEHERNVAAEA
ncbi:MAG: methylated-DNA--[protein]-cysteine S-methyltransferase [Planctomycetes bacterium]|nr:methylated-DNA--[protein]-cysteine S-methyltransferase [Planctomycetota bacterium]